MVLSQSQPLRQIHFPFPLLGASNGQLGAFRLLNRTAFENFRFQPGFTFSSIVKMLSAQPRAAPEFALSDPWFWLVFLRVHYVFHRSILFCFLFITFLAETIAAILSDPLSFPALVFTVVIVSLMFQSSSRVLPVSDVVNGNSASAV